MIGLAVLFAILLVALFTDMRYSKVFNWLTYPGMLLGFGFAGVESAIGASGFWGQGSWHLVGIGGSLSGFLLSGLLMVIVFVVFPAVGGGDVKLIAMCGAFLGPYQGVETLLWMFTIAAGLAALMIIWKIGAWRLVELVGRQCGCAWYAPLNDSEKQCLSSPLHMVPSALLAVTAVLLLRFGVL